ncbi:DUF4349 domain-containing protein [Bacillus sp. FJAT-42376]|uniref:DUF4349 domain-containing protein n=1 Tax=Bacillus sp. FJAT-42376 TaxID=2014076 RepID=UPI000F4F6889|nr:DUF4349 domain-containing protein [Bacillus sp. FJAT-42376]AZB42654.1 DUF4349 domain-containing protein [Bacillus sp. FJAT-42376]
MKKLLTGMIICMMALTGCMGDQSSSKKESADKMSGSSGKSEASIAKTEEAAEVKADPALRMPASRKIIYTAEMRIEVSDYEDASLRIQKKAQSAGGYAVSTASSANGERDGLNEGTMTLRIPQDQFSRFLSSIEDSSYKVIEKNAAGQDVTEEFVDLDSRLKAKQAVEARLLEFMKKAGKTEDLLAISKDLAAVQEDIEQLKGRMKYLQNQTDYSTITIHLIESKVVVPGVDNRELNTWQKTQKQFVNSLNGLLYAGSGLVIFFAGNLPVWILLIIIGWAGVYFWKKKRPGKSDS